MFFKLEADKLEHECERGNRYVSWEIANIAVNPNDHVNFGQSSNDIIPTSIHVSAVLAVNGQLIPSLRHAIETIKRKAERLKGY